MDTMTSHYREPSLPALLEDAWSELEHQGAVVHRVPLSSLSRGEVAVLLWHERRRLRVLMERFAPDPAPFDWKRWRVVCAETEGRLGHKRRCVVLEKAA